MSTKGESGHRDFPRTRGGYINCPQCGCPNKATDANCSFCQAPLSEKETFATKFRQAMETFKWRYKLKSPKSDPGQTAKKLAGSAFTLILGLALSLLGGWFFVSALASSAFSEFIIGALFMLYGVYTIIHVVKSAKGEE